MKCRIAMTIFVAMAAWSQPASSDGQVCVGYRAKKTMFLMKKVSIEGRSCEVRLTAANSGENSSLAVEFPIKSLKSGDSSRDDDVADRLGWAEHPEIRIDFADLMPKIDQDLKAGQELKLKGALRLRGRSVDIEPSIRFDAEKKKYSGEIETDYETFGLKVPTVGGGLIAKAEPKLVLFFELDEAALPSRSPEAPTK